MAEDSLRTLFLGLIKLGHDLPKPGKQHCGKAFHRTSLSALESAKVELHRA